MSRRTQVGRLLVVVVAIALAGPAMADDFDAPTWRGTESSIVTAEWEFAADDEDGEFEPDGTLTNLTNADGGLTTMAYPSEDYEWRTGDGDGELYFAAAGTIEIDVNNVVDEELWKDLWIQITYTGSTPTVFSIQGYDGNTDSVVTGTWHENYDPDSNHHREYWQMLPNPDWEMIVIDVPAETAIDQIIVDTRSIPEPAVLILLVGGAVPVLLKHRRKAKV